MSITNASTRTPPVSSSSIKTDVIPTKLNYSTLPTNGENPYNRTYTPEDPSIPKTNLGANEMEVNIKDLRQRPRDTYSLDQTGFDFFKSPTSMAYEDWNNENSIREKYYAEVEELLKKKLGAHTVQIFDHTVRRLPPPGENVPDTPEHRQPVSRVHVDQTPNSANDRVRRHMPEDQVSSLLSGRYRLINVWRPFHKVYDAPLAVADFSTLDPSKDLVRTELVYPDRKGETFTVLYNQNHEWWSPSQQEEDEVFLLKCFDNKEGVARMVPHTGFVDSRYYAKEGVPPRESIEMRCLVFGGEQ